VACAGRDSRTFGCLVGRCFREPLPVDKAGPGRLLEGFDLRTILSTSDASAGNVGPRGVQFQGRRVAPEWEAIEVRRLGRIVDRRQCGLQEREAVGWQRVAQVTEQVAGVPGIADAGRLWQLRAEQQGLQPAERGVNALASICW